MTGGKAAPEAQAGTGTRNAETRKDDQLARADRKFIQQAAEVGMYEVQIAQLAASKATVKDAQLKAWIDKTLPHLREHLAMAQKLPQAGRGAADASSMGNRAAPKTGS